MTKELAWGLIVALCGACSGGTIPIDPHSSVCVSPEFTAAEVVGIVNAAAEWRDRTGGAADLRLTIGSAVCDVDVVRDTSIVVDGSKACGETLVDGSMVFLDPSSACDGVRSHALHEFGHLLTGPAHSADPADIMCSASPDDSPLTDADVRRFFDNNPYL